MFGRLGAAELVLILGIALVIFGPSKLPEVGKAMGKAISEFKNNVNKDKKEDEDTKEDSDEKEDNWSWN